MFTPAKTVAYEGLVAHAAHVAMAGRPLIDAAVRCWLSVMCEIPASWSQKRRQQAIDGTVRPTGRPDLDNVAKAILDGCNGVVWRDDVLVVDLSVSKRYAATPCVLVEIWLLSGMLPVRERPAINKPVELAACKYFP